MDDKSAGRPSAVVAGFYASLSVGGAVHFGESGAHDSGFFECEPYRMYWKSAQQRVFSLPCVKTRNRLSLSNVFRILMSV